MHLTLKRLEALGSGQVWWGVDILMEMGEEVWDVEESKIDVGGLTPQWVVLHLGRWIPKSAEKTIRTSHVSK